MKKRKAQDYTKEKVEARKETAGIIKLLKPDGTVMSQDLKDKAISYIINKALHTAPNTPEELWKAFDVMFNLQIPTTSCSEEMVAPFEWVWDLWKDKYTQTLTTAPRGGGKALWIDTQVLTKEGWKPIKDVHPGDIVYDENGKECNVIWESEVFYDHKCYDIKFGDNSIFADADHLWSINGDIWTTEQLANYNGTVYVQTWDCEKLEKGLVEVKSVKEVLPVPTKCIGVDSPNKLFVIEHGIVTHNSQTATGLIFLKCNYNKQYEALHAAAQHSQSEVAQKYLRTYYDDPNLRNCFDDVQKKKAKWKSSNSTWSIVTGSMSGLCLSYYTSVITDQGILPIGQIVGGKRKLKVKSYNFETNQVEWRDVINWFDNGKLPDGESFWCIRTENHDLIDEDSPRFTINHKVPLSDGTKKALSELVEGDELIYLVKDTIVFDKFVCLEPCLDPSNRYDITVEGNHNFFLSNGLLSKNSGQHPTLLTIDEIEFMPLDALEQSFACPVDRNGYKKGWHGFSTRQRSYGCLPPTENIVTEHGNKTIEEIVQTKYAGRVLSYNYETKKQEFKRVTNWFYNGKGKDWLVIHAVTDSGEHIKLTATGAHMIPDEKGVKTRLDAYKVGDTLLSISGTAVINQIKRISSWNFKYDIEVEGNHNYYTGPGVLVSNSMSYLTAAAETGDKKIKLYTWSIFESMQRCNTCVAIDREPHGNDQARNRACPLWEYCRGEKAKKSTGFIPREYVIDHQKTLSKDAFETQFLCLRPSTQGLVLPNFTHEYSLPNDLNKGNYTHADYMEGQPIYICTDPAEGSKCVIILFHVLGGKMFVFDSIIIPQCFTTGEAKLELFDLCMRMGYNMNDIETVVVDPHRMDAVKDWASGDKDGIGAARGFKTDIPQLIGELSKIEPGLEILRRYVRSASGEIRLFINKSNNGGIISAVRENHYKTDKTNMVLQGAEQAKAFKDEIDTLRYAVIWVDQKFNQRRMQTSLM